MADLLDQLRDTLGNEYRIERELGGGMSRVFVAEDVRLGRRVVLKVLPPELAGGVNVDRFEREIRLAARLQHPHIVPLLAAGSTGEVPYYVMPYIEGESLRARLLRAGELPLAEAVQLLREVVDALAYAHEHGVVHRDIKPDNILLTAHHAVITDFGVAKAVSEATREGHLTSTGVALGTPAYMAPEQIAGDPSVDHRADIYATGSLAFEMVTGLQPFRGATTQAVLAAHMSQPAPSLTSLRPAVPPALDAVILKCLEKRPADRWQTAAEILPQLDSLNNGATHSSSVTRLAATTAATADAGGRGGSAAAQTFRVAALFGAASLLLLAVVWGLVLSLGLPDWVFQGAVALLAAGLPIMLVTGWRERLRAGGDTATPVGINRLFTWRRAIQGGGLAFAGLTLATAAFMASRAMGVGPGATLVSAGVLAPRDRIIIADFANRTRDSTLGMTVTQLLRIDLAQSAAISVMEPNQVSEVLARMQRDRASDVTPEVAREVAAREGVKAYLTGEILPVAGGFVIAARLLSPSTGDALVTLRQSITSPDELMKGVDRLSSRLREGVGESLRSVRGDPPLEQVTTSSLDALRLYAEATRVADKSGFDEAIPLLEQAVAKDPSFAMAWRRLGIYATNPGQGPLLRVKGDSALQRAYALRHRLPERERLHVEAATAQAVDQDLSRAAAAYTSILERHPYDATALNNLGSLYDRMGRAAEAVELYQRAIETRAAPALTYSNAAHTAGNWGRMGLADSLLRLLERDFPASSDLREAASFIASYRQDFRALDSVAQIRIRSAAEERASGHLSRALVATVHGRMAEAAREVRNALRAEHSRGQLGADEAAMLAELSDIQRMADYSSEPQALARRLAVLWEQNLAFTAGRRPLQRRYQEFAPLFARLGDTTKARQIMDRLLSVLSERDYPAVGAKIGVQVARATVATFAGQPDEAIRMLRGECEAAPGNYAICDQMAFVEVAEAHDRAGRADSAIAGYRRFVELKARRLLAPTRSIDHVTPRIGPVWRRLGELLEAKGERRQAIEAYERFLHMWREADPELQPIVRSVRERVDRLRRMTG